MKKLIAVLLILTTLCAAAVSLADTYRYSEATPITPGSAYRDRIASGTGNLYSFTVNTPGYAVIHFDHAWEDTVAEWFVYLIDRDGNRLGGFAVDPRQEWAVTGVPLGIGPGTWYVTVQGVYMTHPHADYDLTVRFTPTDAFEQEPNDRMGTATPIAVGKPYSGTLAVNGDKDWYRLTLDRETTVRVDFTHEFDTDHDYNASCWQILLVSDRDKEQVSVSANGQDEWGESTDRVTLPAGTWYVRVEPGWVYRSAVPYTFTVIAD